MTPEALLKRIEKLEAQLLSYQSPAEIDPLLAESVFATITTSSKSATSENQSVNEGGASSYSVLKPPDGFIKIGLRYIPFYN